MNFKEFFAEAETIDGQRMGSEAAALRMLEPYRSSNWHFLVFVDGPQDPLPKDLIEGMSIGEFMREGFANVRNDDTPRPRYVIVAEFVMKDQTNMNIRCLDGTNADNPWMWQRDVPFMSRGEAQPDIVQPYEMPKINPKMSDEDWEKQRPAYDAQWRQQLATNIYDKLPSGLARDYGAHNFDDEYYRRYTKIMKGAHIDVVLDKCPLSKASSIRIFPRVLTRKQHMLDGGATLRSQTVREVTRFQIPSTFNGFEQLQGGFQRAHRDASKEAGAVEAKLNDLLQNQIADRAQHLASEIQNIASYLEEEGTDNHDEISNLLADGMYDLTKNKDLGNLAASLWKVSRLIGMMRAGSGQDFSGIWNDFLKYDEPFYEQIFAGLKKILDFARRNLPGYKKEAEKLSQVRQKLIRSLFAVADVTGQPTETLRHRVGLWND